MPNRLRGQRSAHRGWAFRRRQALHLRFGKTFHMAAVATFNGLIARDRHAMERK